MNILITGANGQLGNEMRVLSAQHTQHTYFFTDIAELDITSREAVSQFVKDNAIDIIVNCAAYTNVDKAEIDEDVAHKINSLAVENVGLSGARIIHISTDYVIKIVLTFENIWVTDTFFTFCLNDYRLVII